MKKLFMLMLASGFITVPAFAKKDETAKCDQVISAVSEGLKRNRPAPAAPVTPAPASPAVPSSAPAAPAT